MKKIQNLILGLLLTIAGGFVAVVIYSQLIEAPQVVEAKDASDFTYVANKSSNTELPDLTFAAEHSVKAVVHIKTQIQRQSYSSGNPFLDFFFGDRYYQEQPMQQATGSGVIISEDGYIATNNHVIEDSENILVVLNDGREFEAELIGTDASTDLALLKIDSEDLPTLVFGNSDNLKLGEWVLAVGNPFNLTSTVTAGIVSAKSRGIGIIDARRLPIESFIQTDAAVNPGNSGGALVNTSGQLVGINTAIASRTGSYSGYSFAIPTSIVHKVVEDLKEYGEVQRALIGVSIETVTAEVAEDLNLKKIEGVRVAGISENGGAEEAGIEVDDIIISVEGIKVNTVSELQEQVSKHRPGDTVEVIVKRKNKEKSFDVVLRNMNGGTGIIKNAATILGAELEKIEDKQKERLNIDNGLRIAELADGKLKEAGIKEGFIITHVNKNKVYSVDDIRSILNMANGGVLIEGVYPNGETAYYVFGID